MAIALDPRVVARLTAASDAPPADASEAPPPPANPATEQAPPENPLSKMMADYYQSYSPAALAKAQQMDIDRINARDFARRMSAAADLMSHSKATPPDELQPLYTPAFEQRRALAGQNLQMIGQMLAMDPNSIPSRRAVEGARSAGIPVDRLGLRTAYDVEQYVKSMGTAAGAGKTAAEGAGAAAEATLKEHKAEPITLAVREALAAKGIEIPEGATWDRLPEYAGALEKGVTIRKGAAEAKGAELENGPAPAAILDLGKRFGLELPPETTTKQARETIDAEAKRQGMSIDWAKVGLDTQRVGLERQKQQIEIEQLRSNHPLEPVPGFRFTGVGMPLDRNSQPVQELAGRKASTDQLVNHLDEMEKIYDRTDATGHLAGKDSQRLATLKTQLSGMIGRNASGGRLAEYDVVLGNNQLPDPTSPNPFTGGAFRPEKMRAAIKMIRDMAKSDLSDIGRAHHMLPTTEAAAYRAAEYRAAGVTDPAKIKQLLRGEGY